MSELNHPSNRNAYIDEQMRRANLHLAQQKGLFPLTPEWCWRRDLGMRCTRRAFAESRRLEKAA